MQRSMRLFITPCLSVLLGLSADSPRSDEPPIARRLQPFVDRGTLAGAVILVAARDKVLSVETVGYADVAAKTPMSDDAFFWIASMSKPITATALMLLVDEGKVSLDDPVAKHLPEFRDQMVAVEMTSTRIILKKPSHAITVREILSHTSGLPFSSALEQPSLDLLPLRVAVGSYAMTPLQFEPGTRYQYSNAGLNTAGRIIEVVGGMPFEEFLESRLFRPLGMSDTTFRPTDRQLARLAKAYKPTADKTALEETKITQLAYPLSDPGRQPMPAGGLFSSAHDLMRFCQMILGGGLLDGKRYLSENSVQQMTRKQTGAAVKEDYGLGWSTEGKTFGHGGAFATQMVIDPERGLIVVYLVQHAGFPGRDGDKIFPTVMSTAIERFGK
jgi:CubicO group peptidase (beta-lactamase class C family)